MAILRAATTRHRHTELFSGILDLRLAFELARRVGGGGGDLCLHSPLSRVSTCRKQSRKR